MHLTLSYKYQQCKYPENNTEDWKERKNSKVCLSTKADLVLQTPKIVIIKMATKSSEQMTIHSVYLHSAYILCPFTWELPMYYMALYWYVVFILLSINVILWSIFLHFSRHFHLYLFSLKLPKIVPLPLNQMAGHWLTGSTVSLGHKHVISPPGELHAL